MNCVELLQEDARILTDEVHASHVKSAWFEADWWAAAGAMRRSAPGRGSAWFVGFPPEQWVLRRYLRGGLVRHISSSRYWFTGLSATRAWREFHLLADLHNKGLPVPKPVAARVEKSLLTYSAELLIEELPASDTLADCLEQGSLDAARWQAVGRCIRQLHSTKVWHADLNARNILLGDDAVYLIDFDRARYRKGSGWRAGNLNRLRRSLDKFAAKPSPFHFDEQDWQALMAGYQAK